ncbi:MAG: hypothetical protein E6G77_06570 [Alphaproteobacteria bacterium]|nr:MAG: hypothetical protein E6G77_06570 [Alphaproteobacteria bacterium]
MGEALAILRTAAGATWLGVAWREGGLITKRPLGVGDDVCLLRGLAICIALLPEVAMANANVASMSVDALLKFREDIEKCRKVAVNPSARAASSARTSAQQLQQHSELELLPLPCRSSRWSVRLFLFFMGERRFIAPRS